MVENCAKDHHNGAPFSTQTLLDTTMLNELDWLLNLTLLALGLGAFFINQLNLLRFAAISACSLLFLSFSLDLMSSSVISNMSLVLINTFYLFKIYTFGQLNINQG